MKNRTLFTCCLATLALVVSACAASTDIVSRTANDAGYRGYELQRSVYRDTGLGPATYGCLDDDVVGHVLANDRGKQIIVCCGPSREKTCAATEYVDWRL